MEYGIEKTGYAIGAKVCMSCAWKEANRHDVKSRQDAQVSRLLCTSKVTTINNESATNNMGVKWELEGVDSPEMDVTTP